MKDRLLILRRYFLKPFFQNSFRFISSSSGCFTQTITSFMNKSKFMSSFPVCIPFIFLPYFSSQDFQYDVERSCERAPPCLVLDFSENALSFLLLNMMLVIGFLVGLLHQDEDVTLQSYFTKRFYGEWVLDSVMLFDSIDIIM